MSSVAEGRRCTERVLVEVAAARKALALFEGLNGNDDAARAPLRDSVSHLGLSTCANGVAMALVRDTLLILFRVTDPPDRDRLTLCRISWALQDQAVVASLVQDARGWSANLSHSFADQDAATCVAAIDFIKNLVPPKWDAKSPPPGPRLFNLRTKLKDVRNHVIAHSMDVAGVVMPHRNDII
jgi:hypothetical protein